MVPAPFTCKSDWEKEEDEGGRENRLRVSLAFYGCFSRIKDINICIAVFDENTKKNAKDNLEDVSIILTPA